MWSVFECQLVPWDMVKHLLAKWCLVIAVKRDDTVDGTCCPGEDKLKGEGHGVHTLVLFRTLCFSWSTDFVHRCDQTSTVSEEILSYLNFDIWPVVNQKLRYIVCGPLQTFQNILKCTYFRKILSAVFWKLKKLLANFYKHYFFLIRQFRVNEYANTKPFWPRSSRNCGRGVKKNSELKVFFLCHQLLLFFFFEQHRITHHLHQMEK